MKAQPIAPRLVALRLAALAVVFLGFAVRVRALGAKSLWLDEGLSVNMAGNPLGTMLGRLIAEDIHPPLHYVVLHFWMVLAGTSELAVRFPAVVTGLALVPATYALTLSLFGEQREGPVGGAHFAALFAAALVALSPFLVYYSQEARMYSDLALWGLLSSYALWKGLSALAASPRASIRESELEGGLRSSASPRAAKPRSRVAVQREPEREVGSPSPTARWLVAYALATSLALYTHYFAGLVVAFQALYVALASLRRPRVALAWSLAVAAAGLAYLPWVYGVYRQMLRLATSPDFWQGELSLAFVVEKVFTAFALGKSGVPAQSLPLIAAAALVFAVGLLLLLRRGLSGRTADLYAVLYLVVPLLALYAIAARNPKFTERYLIMIAPVFYVVVARAIVGLAEAGHLLGQRLGGALWVSRGAAAGLAVLALTASAAELRRVYAGPGYEKDDNRAAIAYIQEHEQPGDAVVLMMDTTHVFKYYYRGGLSWSGLHPGDDVVYAANKLNEYLAGKKRLWLLLWQEDWADPTGFTRDAIGSRLTRIDGPGDYRGLKLQLYAVDSPAFSAQMTPRRQSRVSFEDALILLGYDPPPTPPVADGQARLTLYWQATKAIDQDLVVSLRLTRDGFTWARHDQRPAAETYPTTSWKVGRTVTGRLDLPIPLGTPPGEYDLEAVVYSRQARRDLNVIGPDGRPIAPRAQIGKLAVERPATPPDPSKLAIQRPIGKAFGEDLRLLGADVGPESVRPGSSVDLTLYWQALGPTRGDDVVSVSIVDAAGAVAKVAEARPVGGRHPTPDWREGEVVADRYRLIVPPTAAPGQASLRLAVSRAGTGPLPTPDGESLLISSLKLGERPRVGERPTDIQHAVEYRVGEVARLVGYSLKPDRARPGGEVQLTLFWEALGASEVSYVVFTHVLDDESRIWGQQDGVPSGGANPTTGWLPGELVRDEYRLPVKPDAPAGTYLIEIGMYDQQTGARLPIADARGNAIGDRIILQRIAVEK